MNKHQIFQTVILALLTVAVSASEVTLPNEFMAGQRARAGEVNENFDAVKTAVDDNHDRITALEAQVVETGTVSVPPASFIDYSNIGLCNLRRAFSYVYYQNANDDCITGAGVSLPHGATITSVGCLLYDNEDEPNIALTALIRATVQGSAPTSEFLYVNSADTSDNGSPMFYNIPYNSSIVGGELVDNANYTYSIVVQFNTDFLTTPTNLALHGCKVDYTLDD